MKRFLCLFALAVLISIPGSAQIDRRIDPCHAMPPAGTAAAKGFLTFEQFDKELRAALTKQDAIALAFLVTFPMRVNEASGSISLNDAAALQAHFQEIFNPAVRAEILSEKNEDISCGAEGIGYSRGVIWVSASERGYSIWSLNRSSVPPYPHSRWNVAKVEYTCQTQTHRIVVDTTTAGELRYRSWNRPRSVIESPDLQIAKGDGTFEGTNVCAVPIYKFRNGGAIYTVEGGLGCFSDTDGPPKDATGRIEVTLPGKPTTSSWCY